MAEGERGCVEPVPKVRRHGETAERKSGTEAHGININKLPDEIMINIFSSLSFNDLIDTVQNVCTRWKRLAHDPVLWLDKEYVVKARGWMLQGRSCCGVLFTECIHCRCGKMDREILQTAGMVPQLRALTLMRNIEGRVLREICANCPNLTNLSIDGGQKIDYSLLKDILENCPKIQKLKLGENLMADRRCAELVSSSEHLRSLELIRDDLKSGRILLHVLADGCPRLEEINLALGYYCVDDVVHFLKAKRHSLTSATLNWRYVVPQLKECGTSLRKLRLTDFDVPSEEEATVFRVLGELHSLHDLFLDGANPCEPRVISLAFQPGCLTQLRRLKLIEVRGLQDENLVAISRGCPNLRELKVDLAQITDIALSEIHRLKHLEILELIQCNLGGAAIDHVAQLPALHRFVVQFSDLSKLQPSLQHIVDLKELRCLDIMGNHGVEAVPFSEFPGRLTKLRELHVTYEKEEELFFKNVFAELQLKMPRLKIFNTFPLTENDFATDDEADESDGVGNSSDDDDDDDDDDEDFDKRGVLCSLDDFFDTDIFHHLF